MFINRHFVSSGWQLQQDARFWREYNPHLQVFIRRNGSPTTRYPSGYFLQSVTKCWRYFIENKKLKKIPEMLIYYPLNSWNGHKEFPKVSCYFSILRFTVKSAAKWNRLEVVNYFQSGELR